MTARKSTPHAIRRGMSPVERLQVDVISGAPTECWPWTGPRNRWGYGRLNPRGTGELMVHRVAWEHHNQRPIPNGLVVRHTCDNPPCCNPSHLVLGLPRDNRADCVERGRHTYGVACRSAVLDPEAVMELRAKRRAGATYRQLAAMYGLSEVTVRRAALGITWKQVCA